MNWMKRSSASIEFCAAILALLGAGCEKPYRPLPYMPKSAVAPHPVICHDGIGHVPGNKPWILGGNCCCTPTRENYQLHRSAGTIDSAMTYEQYLQIYRDKDIVTDLDHRHCGNLCSKGPHVTMGGHCMATPTVGTAMYERITYGIHGRSTWQLQAFQKD